MIRTPTHDQLAHKGWSHAEIQKTLDVVKRAEAAKGFGLRFLEGTLFYVALAIFIIGNFVLSVVLVPFLILVKGFWLYLTILLFGATFGILFTLVLRYIERLNPGQHIIAGIFIPAIALINMYLIAYFSNQLEVLLQLPIVPHSPAVVSMVYVIAFIAPFLVGHAGHLARA
jgi:hypothetical protein